MPRLLTSLRIAVFLFLEYAWFQNLKGPMEQFALIILLFLVGIKLMVERKKTGDMLRAAFQRLKAFAAQDRRHAVYLSAVVLLFILIRLPAMMYVEGSMDADEAVEGIMTIHIQKGIHRPIVFYEMPVHWTLKSHFTALLFFITGISAKTLQFYDLLLSLGILLCLYCLAREFFDKRTSLIAAFLITVPPSSFYLTSLRVGHYPEVLLWGTFVLFLTARCVRAPEESFRRIPKSRFSWIGFFWGLGLASQLLMGVFILSSFVLLLLKDVKYFVTHLLWRLGLFTLIGSFPLLLFNINSRLATVDFILDPPKAPPDFSIFEKAALVWRQLLLAFGNVDFTGEQIAGPGQVAAVVLLLGFFAGAMLFFLVKRGRSLQTLLLVFPIAATLIFNFNPVRADPAARYMIPLYACFPLFAAFLLSGLKKRWAVLLLLLYAGNNIVSISQQILHFRREDMERMAVIETLKASGIRFVGSGYWQAYPITFLTGETLICTGQFGMPSRWKALGEPVSFDRYDTYYKRFTKALSKEPWKCAFLFEGQSNFEKKFIQSLKLPYEIIVSGKYKIYKINKKMG